METGVKRIQESKESPQQGSEPSVLCSQGTHPQSDPTSQQCSSLSSPCLSWTCSRASEFQLSSVSAHQDTSAISLSQSQPCPWHTRVQQLSKQANAQAWLTTALVRRQKCTQMAGRSFTSHSGVPILLPNPLRAHLVPSNTKSSCSVSCWWQPKVSWGTSPLSNWILEGRIFPAPWKQTETITSAPVQLHLQEMRAGGVESEVVLFQGTAFSSFSTQGCSAQKIAQWPQRLETLFLPYCMKEINIISLKY